MRCITLRVLTCSFLVSKPFEFSSWDHCANFHFSLQIGPFLRACIWGRIRYDTSNSYNLQYVMTWLSLYACSPETSSALSHCFYSSDVCYLCVRFAVFCRFRQRPAGIKTPWSVIQACSHHRQRCLFRWLHPSSRYHCETSVLTYHPVKHRWRSRGAVRILRWNPAWTAHVHWVVVIYCSGVTVFMRCNAVRYLRSSWDTTRVDLTVVRLLYYLSFYIGTSPFIS